MTVFKKPPLQVSCSSDLSPPCSCDTGTSATERMVILPEQVFQALVEVNAPGLRPYRKFVVGAGGRIIPAV